LSLQFLIIEKCTLDLILAPYLIVIKEHLEKNAFEKIMYWTEKCNGLRSLSPSPYHFENKTRAAVQNSLQGSRENTPDNFDQFKTKIS